MTPLSLLTAVELVAGDRPARLVEVERYPDGDPFAHRQPIQRLPARWYFHRVGASSGYRGGTYKGLDLTAGDGTRYEGVLFRAVEHPDGTRTDGPSLLVDWILRATGFATVAELDSAIAERSAWDTSSPLHLRSVPRLNRPIVRTARVGLGLRRFRPASGHPVVRWLATRERYLTDPIRTRTGRAQLAVVGAVGRPATAVHRWRAWYEAGGDPADWYGNDLSPEGLCRLLGWADRQPSTGRPGV